MFKKFGQDLPQSLVDAVSGIMEAGLPEPAKPDPEAIARRKRLQALKDKAEDEKAEKGEEKPKSNVKVHKGTYGTEYKGDMEEAYKNSSDGTYHNPHKDAAKGILKGNQHKIDANKNGKIDADDFKILRGKKKANEEVEEIDETSYSAKAARAGKDIGKPGKEFSKIAKSAGERYGSAEKGKKVAGAILAKLRKEDVEEIEERELTPGETEKKEKYVKSMKKGLAGFKKRYGERGKSVMYATATKMAKEEVELEEELVLDLTEGASQEKKSDLPFEPDTKHGKIAVAGKKGYGVSASRHLARMGLKKMMDKTKNETMMGKAGCTSEENEIEESRGHKIIATKLKQIDMMSSGKAPDYSMNNQSIKDKLKDASNVKKSEIVTQKDTSMHDSAVDNENDELEMKHKLNKMSHGYGNVHHAEEVEYTTELTEEHSFGSNVDSHIKSLGHGKIGFVMDQKKDGLIAVHHQDGSKHHVSIFHKGNLVHQSTHDNFENASGHAHSALTTKKGMKSLNLMNETAALDQYIKSMGYDPLHMDKNKKVMFSKTNAFKTWAQQKEALYDGGQKGTQDIEADNMSPSASARGGN